MSQFKTRFVLNNDHMLGTNIQIPAFLVSPKAGFTHKKGLFKLILTKKR